MLFYLSKQHYDKRVIYSKVKENCCRACVFEFPAMIFISQKKERIFRHYIIFFGSSLDTYCFISKKREEKYFDNSNYMC